MKSKAISALEVGRSMPASFRLRRQTIKTKHHDIHLFRTKLHRPPIPADHLPRSELLKRLDKHPDRPLVLVSAPAGYGKSTLVSCWLKRCGKPSAWLSLDENDDDLHQFLSCFIGALQMLFPEAVRDTMALIHGPDLPPATVLAASMVNDLERVDQRFVVVLDDIHRIKKKAISDFLNLMLRHPSASMQLVLVGRRDPALPIASLRARGVLTELRMRDLRFTVDEASRFLQAAAEHPLEKEIIAALVQKAEGWVTGLRLAVLVISGQDDPGSKLLELKGTTHYVMDYLVSEVLERQPADKRDFLLRTAILQRFCAPLCDAVMAAGETTGVKSMDGQAFMEWLREQNLFLIPLDTENKWFRYHHLFQDLLKDQLQRKTSPEDMAAFYSGASAWSEDQAFIEDAIRYALAAGDAETAADIVERHRDAEFDGNRWYVADRWLNMLPEQIRQQRPRLLLTEARVLNDRFRLMDIPPIVERAMVLLEAKPGSPLDQGELLYFLGFLCFWQGDGCRGGAFLDRALKLVPESHAGYLRAQIELFVGLTTLINGRKDEAIETLSAWIEKRHFQTGIVWERLKYGLAVTHFLSGDLSPAYHDSRLLRDDGRRTGQTFIETWGDYLLGIVAFHRHELDEACRHFGQVVKNKFAANHRAAIDSMVGLAVSFELLGQPDQVDQLIALAHDYAQWTEDETMIDVAFSCEARIAVLRGDLNAAVMWQRGFRIPPHVPGMIFFLANPWITACRVLSAAGTDADLTNASEKLRYLRQETESLHYTCQIIEIIVLQAMVAHQQGRTEEAFDFLQHALNLAEPGGWIRPFIELGPPMADLLRQLPARDVASGHARKILAVFENRRPFSPRPQPLDEPLTHRELDVLEQLSKRLQNKEIADKLSISPKTVKAHLSSIYQKLQVTKRREAVEKAAMLKILPGG